MAPWLWGNGEGSFWGWNGNGTVGGIRLEWYGGSANTSVQNLVTEAWTTATAISGNMASGAAVGNFQYAAINLNDGTSANPVWAWSTNTVYSTPGWDGTTHNTTSAAGTTTFGVFALQRSSSPGSIKFNYTTYAFSFQASVGDGVEGGAFSDSSYGHYSAAYKYEWTTDAISTDTAWPGSLFQGAFGVSNQYGAVIGMIPSSGTSVPTWSITKSSGTFTSGPPLSTSLLSVNSIAGGANAERALASVEGTVSGGYATNCFAIALPTSTVTISAANATANPVFPTGNGAVSTSSAPAWF